MILVDVTTGRRLAERVSRAGALWTRLVGWLHRRSIEADEGLWFDRCDAIHTLGMRTPLDVIFLDAQGRVQRTITRLPPNRPAVGCRGARVVIEMGPGFLEQQDLPPGHVLELREPD